jgi:hypothetical protein
MLMVLAALVMGFRIAPLSLIPCFFQLLLVSPLFTASFFYGEIQKQSTCTGYDVIPQLHLSCFNLLMMIERGSMHGRMLFRQCGTKATGLMQVASTLSNLLGPNPKGKPMNEFLGCKI